MKKFNLTKSQKDFNKGVYAGLAGGLLVYFALEGMNEFIRILSLPNIFIIKVLGVFILSIILFIIMALTPVFLKGGKNKMCLNWKRVIRAFGIALVAFSSAWLGWSFSFTWENKFLWMVLVLIVGAVLSSLD